MIYEKLGLEIASLWVAMTEIRCVALYVMKTDSIFEFVIWRSLLSSPPITEIITDLIKFISQQKITDLPDQLHQQIMLRKKSYTLGDRYKLNSPYKKAKMGKKLPCNQC